MEPALGFCLDVPIGEELLLADLRNLAETVQKLFELCQATILTRKILELALLLLEIIATPSSAAG